MAAQARARDQRRHVLGRVAAVGHRGPGVWVWIGARAVLSGANEDQLVVAAICGVNSYSRGRRESVPGGCGRDVLSRTPPRTRIRTAAHRINLLVFVRASRSGDGALTHRQRLTPVPKPWRGDRRSCTGEPHAAPSAADDAPQPTRGARTNRYNCSRRARQDVAPEPPGMDLRRPRTVVSVRERALFERRRIARCAPRSVRIKRP